MKFFRTCIAVLLAALAAGTVQAETRFFGSIGYSHGGDELGSVSFTDGSSQTLRAGSGLSINAGGVHGFAGTNFALQATVGYLIEDTSASNTNIRFSRYPVEFLGFWRNADHRLGGGVVHHMSPTFDMDNLGGKVEFDNATGFALEYGYRNFSVRYTAIDYAISGVSGSVDGNGIGLFFSTGY